MAQKEKTNVITKFLAIDAISQIFEKLVIINLILGLLIYNWGVFMKRDGRTSVFLCMTGPRQFLYVRVVVYLRSSRYTTTLDPCPACAVLGYFVKDTRSKAFWYLLYHKIYSFCTKQCEFYL